MIPLVFLMAATAGAGDAGGSLVPVEPAAAVAMFKRLCVEPFPTPAKFEAALAAERDPLRKAPKTPEQAMQPGEAYYSDTAEIFYAADEGMPRDLPSPQCRLTVRLADAPDHAAIMLATASALGLPAGKTAGKGRVQTQWDVPVGADKSRYFLATTPAFGGSYQMSLSILNLRGRK